MKTYQDLLKVGENKMSFLESAINDYKGSAMYSMAKTADDYVKQQNTTITNYRKMLYTISGQEVPDNWSANYKLASNFFYRLVMQENQFLLGNGVTWQEESTGEKLGNDFDIELQKITMNSLVAGVAYGFFNYDHIEGFSALEFVPFYDEENGALMAGIRFWQIASDKPLRATLYEIDGITDYLWEGGKGTVLKEKHPYINTVGANPAGDTEIYDGENYPTFPIVPMWGNPLKQSELVGMREQIDAYDLIKSGFANDLDDASQIYWTLQNAGGMDDIDLVKFVERMKTVKAAVVDSDGATAEAHTMDVPYAGREAILSRLEKDIYRDFMGLNPEQIAAGQVTATQIQAAYEPLNEKADLFEYQVIDFLQRILDVAGIEDSPTFTRSMIINAKEEIEKVILSAQYLTSEYVTEKILTILGDIDRKEEVLDGMDKVNVERMTGFEQKVNDDEEDTER